MANKQNFPGDVALVDDQNMLTLPWLQWFLSIFARTGGTSGNNAATFNYPESAGNVGQVLTSAGTAKPTIWTTVLTKLSQFTNDAGFLTVNDLGGFSTPGSTQTQIQQFVLQTESNDTPFPDSTAGSAGSSTNLSRADHSHPRELSPVFQISVAAPTVKAGIATWTSGTAAPTSTMPAGSLYSRTTGTLGARLYVSSGAGWNPIPGV